MNRDLRMRVEVEAPEILSIGVAPGLSRREPGQGQNTEGVAPGLVAFSSAWFSGWRRAAVVKVGQVVTPYGVAPRMR